MINALTQSVIGLTVMSQLCSFEEKACGPTSTTEFSKAARISERPSTQLNNLVHGFWFGALGAVGLIGGMVAAYYYRRAERRWGSGGKTPTV